MITPSTSAAGLADGNRLSSAYNLLRDIAERARANDDRPTTTAEHGKARNNNAQGKPPTKEASHAA